MAGKIINIINHILEKRAKGNKIIIESTKIRMILDGINPDDFDIASEDDPEILQKLQDFAKKNNISLSLI